MKPRRAIIRSYQVGFGDCFLLSFDYETEQRHVLIDFGSTGLPEGVPKNQLDLIAKDIAKQTGGKLTAVIATHRHKDHISGFATKKKGNSSGSIIAGLKPDLVLQPWTEDPDIAAAATGPRRRESSLAAYHVSSLAGMQLAAAKVLSEVRRVRYLTSELRNELSFLGDNNLANLDAIENLMTMGQRREYASALQATQLQDLLPGVTVDILGPPTIDQSATIEKQRSRDQDEFWHLMAHASSALGPVKAGKVRSLFPLHEVAKNRDQFPIDARWLINQAKRLRGDQMLRIVRILDQALNNTSLILLFKAGSKSLLFPGDAQIENWSYALNQPEIREKLKTVDLYKVGHHGSLNATPKSLWKLFEHKSKDAALPGRLQTLMSTMAHKHGAEERHTEVPRQTLVQALDRESTLFSTQSLGVELFHPTVVEFE
ncbi:hypothetical protein G6L08_34595 [Agrobacterium rhizogenes]|nr:hypothetical protein [Rhizobium rhizogenes]NTG32273.1 hypothetical protein [Rhizobium rhizogenes]